MRHFPFVPVLLAFILGSAAAWSADPSLPPAQLAVDQVSVRNAPPLRGSILSRLSDGTLTMAVSRVWLGKSQPKLDEALAAEAAEERRAALEQLRDRIAVWRERRADETKLEFFLKKQAERIDKELARPEDKPEPNPDAADAVAFHLVVLPATKVERFFLQPPERKQLAAVAWREGLPHVETRSASDLARELKKRGIDPTKESVDLSDRLPVRRQTDAEWAARQALVEYQYRQSVDFQGAGTQLFRTGEGAQAPAAGELLLAIFKEQLAAQLADLLTDPAAPRHKPDSEEWLTAANRLAEKEEARGFRVTRVATDMARGRVAVETRFVARMAAGTWETVWKFEESVATARADKDRVDRIAVDPQVQAALELLKTAGLGEEDAAWQSALRMGAATMQAQEAADAHFAAFRDRLLQRLEGPPLLWETMR